MAKAIIDYDEDLPEIPGRLPWEKPSSHLLKDGGIATGQRGINPNGNGHDNGKHDLIDIHEELDVAIATG